MIRNGWTLLASIGMCLAMALAAQAQQPVGSQPTARTPNGAPLGAGPVTLPPDTVVAIVDGVPVKAAEVGRVMLSALGGVQINADMVPMLQAQALDQLISQKLVSAFLAKYNVQATPEEIQAGIAALEKQAAARGLNIDALLAEKNLTKEDFREHVAWDATWNKFAQERIKDADLQAFFNAHRRDYDGGEVRVSHILLRVPGTTTPAALEGLMKQAASLRAEIVAGKISFADAAARFSAGPSRLQGGDLGFIPRHDRMAETFSTAAFALEKGEISQPTATYFGVHLIQVTDVTPGSKTWQDVRAEIVGPAGKELFARLAADLRSKAKIEFTGAIAHLDPITKQLVNPAPKK